MMAKSQCCCYAKKRLERDRGGEGVREGGREKERVSERERVCVCVCERERMRENERGR